MGIKVIGKLLCISMYHVIFTKDKLPCEYNKVVTDILAKVSFLLIWKLQLKHAIKDIVQV